MQKPEFLFGGSLNGPEYALGSMFALIAAFLSSIMLISIQLANSIEKVGTSVYTFYGGIGLLFSVPVWSRYEPNTILSQDFWLIPSQTWGAMIAISIFGFFAMVATTRASKMLNATVISFVRSLEIVFAFLMQVFVLHEFSGLLSVAGSALVVLSVIGITLQQYLPNRCQDN